MCLKTFPVVLLAGLCLSGAAYGSNLLVNGGFEEELAPAWERRTLDDAQRRITRAEGAGRRGAAAALENAAPVHTRLRQGHDRSIIVAPGSIVELSAWVKSEQDEGGEATLQLYCMDKGGKILAQPVSPPEPGAFDWTRLRVRSLVPPGTAYVMAYLQTRGGVGRVLFDDAALEVKRAPEVAAPAPKIVLLTDLPEGHAVLERAQVLVEGLVRDEAGRPGAFEGAAGAIALFEGAVPEAVWPSLQAFARGGGRVFMDLRAFARCHGAEAAAVGVGAAGEAPLAARMAAGLRAVKAGDATAGFEAGQVMPRAGWPDGRLAVLPQGFDVAGLEVLAVAPGGEAGLVRLPVGAGSVTACDLLSLREPHWRNVDAYYAFTPVSGALGNPVRLGRYFPARLDYDGVVAEMRQLAAAYPGVTVADEGEASGGYRLWSLNLGAAEGPLYFLYAAAHGSEWEPGYGLLVFAQRLAAGELADAVDLKRVRVKIMPVLNPWGYVKMRRQNANGVDLNRQGDYRWEPFKGRDSNGDGVYGPNDYDWKGGAPFTEPEARAYLRIVQDQGLHCILDFHGNASAKSNKFGILPLMAHPDNEDRALDMQRIANARLRGRHLLRQSDEEMGSQYLLDYVRPNNGIPGLMNTGAAGRFGLLIELTAGYAESYGTLLQTDVTCELCRALFLAYPP
jgi:hypothetical protein